MAAHTGWDFAYTRLVQGLRAFPYSRKTTNSQFNVRVFGESVLSQYPHRKTPQRACKSNQNSRESDYFRKHGSVLL
jgi:hypothetical protein